jgi:hypothetical protein
MPDIWMQTEPTGAGPRMVWTIVIALAVAVAVAVAYAITAT